MKKWLSVWISLLLTAALMMACTGGGASGDADSAAADPADAGTAAQEEQGDGTNDSAEPSGEAPAAAEYSNEPVELTFYLTVNNQPEETFMELYGNKIKENLPHINIRYIMQQDSNTLSELITTGETIDILISSVGHAHTFLTPYNLQYDISDLIEKYNYDAEKLEPTNVEILKGWAEGGMWGLPVSTTSAALFYNKDLFDQFGVGYPQDGMTWDELFDLARTMTRVEGGVQYKGMAMAFQHMMLLDQRSNAPIDPETLEVIIEEEDFKQTFENFARFFTIPGNEIQANSFTLGPQTKAFIEDRTAAMYLTLSGTWQNLGDMNWDVVQLPFHEDLMGIGPQSYPTFAFITSTSEQKDAAFQVLDYLTSEDFQRFTVQSGKYQSILKDKSVLEDAFGVDSEGLLDKNYKSLFPETFAPPAIKTRHQTIVDRELYAAVVEYQNGKDINTVMREAAERARQKIREEMLD